MLKLRKILVTGIVASGKSTVCRFLSDLGAYSVNCDEIVHSLLSPSTQAGKEVVELLGEQIVDNETLDRKEIARLVFENETRLQAMENILHPEVGDLVEREYDQACEEGRARCFVCEVPVLTNWINHFEWDMTLHVQTSLELAKKRFLEDNRGSEKVFLQIVKRQQDRLSQFLPKPAIQLINDGDLHQLELKTTQALEMLEI